MTIQRKIIDHVMSYVWLGAQIALAIPLILLLAPFLVVFYVVGQLASWCGLKPNPDDYFDGAW